MIDIPTMSAIVVAVSVIVGLVFTLMEIRHLTRTRRTDVIMRIYDRFGTKEMVEAIMSVGKLKPIDMTLRPFPAEALTGATQVATAFEGLGVLLEQRLIDIELVNSLFGPTLDAIWEPINPVIRAMRESLKQPFFFSHFEYLHERLNAYRAQNVKNP